MVVTIGNETFTWDNLEVLEEGLSGGRGESWDALILSDEPEKQIAEALERQGLDRDAYGIVESINTALAEDGAVDGYLKPWKTDYPAWEDGEAGYSVEWIPSEGDTPAFTQRMGNTGIEWDANIDTLYVQRRIHLQPSA